MQINDFALFLAVKYVKVYRLEWKSNLTCDTTHQMYMPSFKLISHNMYKNSLENFSLAGSSSNTPFQVFLSARGPTIAQPWRKSVGIKTLTI